MTSIQIALIILGSALGSSLLTLYLLKNWVRYQLMEDVEKRWEKASEEFAEKMRDLSREAADEFEEKVSEGVRRGFTSLPSTEVLRETTKGAVKTGGEFVQAGLEFILNPAKKKP